jgi:CRP-like cAMP-binding protein
MIQGAVRSRVAQKLSHGAPLTDEDRRRLDEVTRSTRDFEPRGEIISEGDRPDDVHFITEGYACRYKIVPDGGRQIMAWLAPGDACDLHVSILGEMDHSIAALSPCKVAFVPRRTIDELMEGSPAITRAFWWATLVDEGILREWLVSMGRRPADRQVAHLFCELLTRLQAVGLAEDNMLELPVTQAELADTTGLSAVHVNRVIHQLRHDQLISLHGKRLTIHDPDRLKAFAQFDPLYLHLPPRS